MSEVNFKVNNKIEIISEEDETYSSDIQDIDEKSIAISVPIKGYQYLALKKRERIDVLYYEGNCIYKFSSVVIKRTNSGIPLIWINKPNKVKRIQRRKFVRVPVLSEIKFAKIDRKFNLEKASLKNIKFSKGIVLDLSGGGVRLRVDLDLNKEDVLAMILPIGEELIIAKGEVKRIEVVNIKEKIYGIKFIELTTKQEDAIIKYVFEIMRQQMKKGLKEE